MNNYLNLYLLTRLDGICGMLSTLVGVFAIILVIAFIGRLACLTDKNAEVENATKIGFKIFLPILIVSIILSISIPTKNEAIFIIAGGKTIDFIQNDTSICKLPAQTTAIISNYLDKQIKEIETTKQKQLWQNGKIYQ